MYVFVKIRIRHSQMFGLNNITISSVNLSRTLSNILQYILLTSENSTFTFRYIIICDHMILWPIMYFLNVMQIIHAVNIFEHLYVTFKIRISTQVKIKITRIITWWVVNKQYLTAQMTCFLSVKHISFPNLVMEKHFV